MWGSNDVVGRSVAHIREIVAGADALTDPQRERLLDLVAHIEDAERTSRSAGRRISTIVGSLKEFARLDHSAQGVVDLGDGIESTLALVQHLLGDRIVVRREYGDVPRVRCYPDKMNQAYMNLLLNAVQAIPGRGEITVRTHVSAGSIDVEVSDTGVGIPGENIDRIFDPGFTTNGVKVGTGLGLSIVHRIMEEHGGRVDVESAPGAGSTFRLRIPIERAMPGAGA
jgi:signal transduction histidine kinase